MSREAGRRPVRISDVAAAAGVSKALVSYALNDRPGVSESTRAHIAAVARSMGWTPSVRARSLSSNRAYAIGLVFEISVEALASDEWVMSFMAGMQSVLAAAQYALVTEVVADSATEIAAYSQLARDGRIDGIVLMDPQRDDRRMAMLDDLGLPYVSLGPTARPTDMPVLVYDEAPAITAVVDHLVGLGHRRIAQVCGPQTTPSASLRRRLYQRALEAHGVDGGWWIESDYTAPGGRNATTMLLADPDPPTAVIYSNDIMAIGGMSGAINAGLRVPDDLSVVGWDGITVAQYLHPALSTVSQHPYEDGRTAASVLLEAIEGRRFQQTVSTADPTFVPRESSARAPR
ncbi:LacI family DNA-binding transcriptional regulator [Agromyces bauzanensis]|uniref:LacI family transcriptional regulator n=1 Tax=Agromyces bauzanensis TaxID=1308924 RepID=A0A917PLK7_9MICO|nr:LacI family DNA-binding transcriptional regulator [Agromyces bauzanensis]GGJ83423.1 LacI family transcriptional regulator [Agromyces bauzanensis]